MSRISEIMRERRCSYTMAFEIANEEAQGSFAAPTGSTTDFRFMSNPGEIYIQFPDDWKWADAERWLADHGIKATKKPSEMPYRWGAWRPIKGSRWPVDVYVFVKLSNDEVSHRSGPVAT